MLDPVQIFSIIIGTGLMCWSGHNWSSDILHRAVSKNETQLTCELYINSLGFLFGLLLILSTLIVSNQIPDKEKPPVYILFLDSSVIKDTHLRINNGALEILNNFLKKTNAKIIITSNDKIKHTTQTNWPIDTLKAICKARGIKGVIIGSIPHTKHVLTRCQEINLWYNITKVKYDGCVILDKTSDSTNKMGCTVKVKNLLTDQHIIAIMDKLKVAPNPDVFKEKVQTYEEQFKTRFG